MLYFVHVLQPVVRVSAGGENVGGIDLDDAVLESDGRHLGALPETDAGLVHLGRVVYLLAAEPARDPPRPRVDHDGRGLESPLLCRVAPAPTAIGSEFTSTC